MQTPVDVSGELELLLELSTRLNQIQQEEEIILGVTLRNPTSESIPLPLSDGCLVQLNVNEVPSLNMPCFAGFQSLEPYEQTLLGHVLFEDASFVQGLNTVQASLPSQILSNSVSFNIEDLQPIDTSLQTLLFLSLIHI